MFNEGLTRFPTPGLDGSYVTHDSVRTLPVFGDTRFKIDADNLTITNVTESNHLLYPGTVERKVFTVDKRVFIETRGTGSGNYGYLNVAGANLMWHAVDAQIARSLTGLVPPTIIRP